MATLYLDFTNGNDSNNATTFANRAKTITSGITAARTAPGDTIRIMKSENPVSLGINATFTNKSDTVTLASALTANIDLCETAWTAAANVTAATSTVRREGSNAAQLTVASAFTTGIIGYKALASATDFSAYTKISFAIQSDIAIAASVLRVDLCSDAAGATPVNSFTIDRALTASTSNYHVITYDNGSALGSSIQSVSLYALSDPGTPVIRLDNIIACNGLTLTSVISLSSSATALDFYPIKSINGTTIKLDNGQANFAGATERGYSGTTTTATIYKVEPIFLSAAQTIQEAGSQGTRSTYSGGWNTTDMSTQTGLTFVDMGRVAVSTPNLLTIANYIDFEKIVFVRGQISGSTNVGIKFTSCGIVCANQGIRFSSFVMDSCYVNSCNNGLYSGGSGICYVTNSTIISCATTGIGTNSAAVNYVISDTTFSNSTTGLNPLFSCKVYRCTFKDNSTGIISSGFTTAVNCTFTGNTTGVSSSLGIVQLHNCTVDSYNRTGGRIVESCVGGDPAVARIYENTTAASVSAQIVNTPVHGTTTKSWNHIPSNWHTSDARFCQELSPIAVASSGTLTFSIWVRRDSTNVGAAIMLRGGQTTGVASDVSVSMTAAINTWEQLTITASPTQAVPLIIELQSWQISGSGNVYFGDASVSQA